MFTSSIFNGLRSPTLCDFEPGPYLFEARERVKRARAASFISAAPGHFDKLSVNGSKNHPI
jgi:hypothetical protein